MATPDTDPFAGMDFGGGQTGGVRLSDGSWVPKNHSLAQTAAPAAPATGGGAGTPAPGATPPGTPPASPASSYLQAQAANAQTYSQTPGAAPTQTTANQGTQDVVRNSYLQQATQGTRIDTADPNFRQQVDPFAAAVTREKRDFLSDQAEKAGPYATGALRGQARMASERAGQAIGSFEADLVGRELTNRRNEIQAALSGLRGTISEDQQRMLQRELAALQAEMQRLSITTGADVARSGQSLQQRLAQMQDAFNRAQLAQQDRQFGDTLGFNVGVAEQNANQSALNALFG